MKLFCVASTKVQRPSIKIFFNLLFLARQLNTKPLAYWPVRTSKNVIKQNYDWLKPPLSWAILKVKYDSADWRISRKEYHSLKVWLQNEIIRINRMTSVNLLNLLLCKKAFTRWSHVVSQIQDQVYQQKFRTTNEKVSQSKSIVNSEMIIKKCK
jgi:hypothetical protein